MLETTSIIVAAFLLASTTVIVYLLYDPYPELRHLPHASLFVRTGLWLRMQELLGREVMTVHNFHHKLGPLIRLSRNAVSVASDSTELRKIHTRSQCAQKSAHYEDLLITFHRPLFGLHDVREHADRRAGFGKTYSRALDYRQTVDMPVSHNLASMDGHVVNAIDIFWSSVVQSNEELLFGTSREWPAVSSYEQLRRRRRGENIGHGSPVEKLRLIAVLPPWLRRRLRSRIPRTRAVDLVEDGCRVVTKAGSSETPCGCIEQHLRREIAGGDRTLSLAQEKLLHQRVHDEMIDQLTGGTDFPLSVLACALSLLAQPAHQHWQDQIREPGEEKVTAVLNEVLRLYPPAAGSQPRELLQTVVLTCSNGSVTLRSGVVVHAQPFTLHRAEETFSKPESFMPERWLGEDDAKTSNLWAFGKGPTHCVAQEYATKLERRMLRVACERARFFSETELPDLRHHKVCFLLHPKCKCEFNFAPETG